MSPRLPHEEEMNTAQRAAPPLTNMVDNAGMGGPQPQPGWADWSELQQRMARETTQLSQAILEQLVSNQNAANAALGCGYLVLRQPSGRRQKHWAWEDLDSQQRP